MEDECRDSPPRLLVSTREIVLISGAGEREQEDVPFHCKLDWEWRERTRWGQLKILGGRDAGGAMEHGGSGECVLREEAGHGARICGFLRAGDCNQSESRFPLVQSVKMPGSKMCTPILDVLARSLTQTSRVFSTSHAFW